MDWTNDFDKHIEAMQRTRNCPTREIDAANMVNTRLETAKVICKCHGFAPQDHAALLAVFSELCAEARSGHGSMVLE